MTSSTGRGLQGSESTRSRRSLGSRSARSIIISEARTTSWRRCSTSSTNWRWRAFESMWLFIAEMRRTFLTCCSPNSRDGLRNLGSPGRVSHALSWNLPICQVIQHVLSHVVTKRQSNPGTRNYLQARKLSLHRTLRGRWSLLVEGAVALTLIHGNRDYAEAALRAAKKLVRRRRGPPRQAHGHDVRS